MQKLLKEEQRRHLMSIIDVFNDYIDTLPEDVLLPPAVDEMIFFSSFAVKELDETPVES